MVEYVALIHRDEGSDFGVSFPDFPGCVTAGATLEEARAMAAEALALHVEGMIEDGEPIPAPSSFTQIMEERENRDAVAVLVLLPARSPRTVRVNITLTEDVLAEIDAYAEEHGLTRSGFIAKATKEIMEVHRAARDFTSLPLPRWAAFLQRPASADAQVIAGEVQRFVSGLVDEPRRRSRNRSTLNMHAEYVYEFTDHPNRGSVLEPAPTAKRRSSSSAD